MDIEEFTKQAKPRAKRSKLEPFKKQIFTLKEMGYVDWQIKEWLETEGLVVSRQAVQQFIKKRESEVLNEAIRPEIKPVQKAFTSAVVATWQQELPQAPGESVDVLASNSSDPFAVAKKVEEKMRSSMNATPRRSKT